MITYTWQISQLETIPQEGNLHDVVRIIHWRYKATDGEYSAETYSSYTCPQPSETDFTAYPDLTEEKVISWLEAGLNVEAMKESLNLQIEQQKNPPIVVKPLPWNQTTNI